MKKSIQITITHLCDQNRLVRGAGIYAGLGTKSSNTLDWVTKQGSKLILSL